MNYWYMYQHNDGSMPNYGYMYQHNDGSMPNYGYMYQHNDGPMPNYGYNDWTMHYNYGPMNYWTMPNH